MGVLVVSPVVKALFRLSGMTAFRGPAGKFVGRDAEVIVFSK